MTVLPNILAAPKREDVEDMMVGGESARRGWGRAQKMDAKKVMLQDTPSQKIIDMLKRLFAERRPR
jgi:hypothetical protein